MTETVLTSRRARVLVAPRRWVPGRLRLSDHAVGFTAADASMRVDLPLAEVTAVRLRRATVSMETADATLRLRCFGTAGVAALIEAVRIRRR